MPWRAGGWARGSEGVTGDGRVRACVRVLVRVHVDVRGRYVAGKRGSAPQLSPHM